MDDGSGSASDAKVGYPEILGSVGDAECLRNPASLGRRG